MKIQIKIFKSLIVAATLTVIPGFNANAQQDPGFTHYMYNTQSVNAAYAGTTDGINIVMLSRHQWIGFDGAPQTQTLTAHGPVYKKYVGLGLSYTRDRIGPLDIDNVFVDYSFKIQVHDGGFVSFGLKTGLDIRSNNLTELNPLQGTDPAYNTDIIGKLSFNFGAGVYYYTPNYYFGVSLPRLRRTNYNANVADYLNEEVQERHLFVIGGYVWDVNREWKLKPSFFAKHVGGAPLSFDLNLSTMFRETVVAGVSHRFGDSFGMMMQFKVIDFLWMGYGYDFTITPLKNQNRGTHEVLLLFDIEPPLRKQALKYPRFS